MFWTLITIFSVNSKLLVQSPDSLKHFDINIQVATFGNPSFYSSYGKLHTYENCEILDSLNFETFVLLVNSTGICISQCAKNIEDKGGKGIIVVQDSPQLIYKECEVYTSGVVVLGLDRNLYNNHFINHKNIWITYRYELFESYEPFVEVKLSGDFSKDLVLAEGLLRLNNKSKISWFNIRFQLICNTDSEDVARDCLLTPSKNKFCLPGKTYPGSQILQTYTMILNVFEQLNTADSTTDYLHYLKSVLSTCDYNTSCTNYISQIFCPNVYQDVGVLDRYGTVEELQERVVINSVNVYWPEFLESAYCLSFLDPPDNCEECSEGCLFESVRSKNCSVWCDNEECGFNNLACLEENECFNFMINDGNCNNVCLDDLDCIEDGQYIKFFIWTVLVCCIIVFFV